MKKVTGRIIMIIALIVCLLAAGLLVITLVQYRTSEKLYEQAAEQYTDPADRDSTGEEAKTDPDAGNDGSYETAPVVVDFDALKKVNEDVAGWIYCEDTVINYPVMYGSDNDFYLHHSYEGNYSASGSIFIDYNNKNDLSDTNTIIYGHHMKDKSMFATLSNWAEQEYYEEHPVVWLLTPEQDYKIVLFGGYTTSASSDTYTIYQDHSEELVEYLQTAASQSDFKAAVSSLPGDAHFVVLSTCAYVFDNARYVLHGYLEPVDSAGGVPLS